MTLHVVIPCVGYDDFLRETLPTVTSYGLPVTIVTSPTDVNTLAIAEKFDAKVITTSIWTDNHAKFNKSGALNVAIASTVASSDPEWLLMLDADILLTFNPCSILSGLATHKLYSVSRRLCSTPSDLDLYHNGRLLLSDFPLYKIPIVNNMAWGHRKTANPEALIGYFHLWNCRATSRIVLPESSNAASYDVEFAMSFGDTGRSHISGYEVLHLGPLMTNWDGRISPKWHIQA